MLQAPAMMAVLPVLVLPLARALARDPTLMLPCAWDLEIKEYHAQPQHLVLAIDSDEDVSVVDLVELHTAFESGHAPQSKFSCWPMSQSVRLQRNEP